MSLYLVKTFSLYTFFLLSYLMPGKIDSRRFFSMLKFNFWYLVSDRILFLSSFQVKKKHFFRNFMTIILFGAVGSLISFFIISLGMFTSADMLTSDGYGKHAVFLEYKMLHCSILSNQTDILLIVSCLFCLFIYLHFTH